MHFCSLPDSSLQVLTAASRRMDEESGAGGKSEEHATDVEVQGQAEGEPAVDSGNPYPLVQQLLCSFIELASKTEGDAAVHALRTIGQLLATQQPLVLASERASWLRHLLDWLQHFLTDASDGGEGSGSGNAEVRGVAAGAMLDLGVCSGSLRCVLLTVDSLLESTVDAAASATKTPIECQHILASVGRLQKSSSKSMSSPCNCATSFLEAAHLEAPQASAQPRVPAPVAPSPAFLQPSSSRLDAGRGKSGKFVSVACDGRYLYVHSADGLTKYGTGYSETTLGRVYIHKACYQTQRPWLACVGSRLYLRSYAMAPDSLVVLDANTLEQIGRVNPSSPASVPLHADGSASAMFPEKGLSPEDSAGVGGGRGDGGSGDSPGGRHPGATDAPGPGRTGSAEMEVVDASESDEPIQEPARPATAPRDFLQQYRENLMRGRTSVSIRQRASAVLSTTLEQLTARL